ncbi:MAG: Carbon monoxide dehydrogenase large chain [Alphaproteobacteria bacterium MarineAlpha3_Bin7]|nr:MAG: Carbon monoxide dehydrogenase large chain [Alphaproteobacteria bacterium MarineAlpha3_Bin7]
MTNQATMRFGRKDGKFRSEDVPLVTGSASFSDDINAENQLYASFLRSPVGHGEIISIKTSDASKVTGVSAIFTAEDLEKEKIGSVPPIVSLNGKDGKPMAHAPIPVLAGKRVRYIGEPIAIIISETYEQCQEASELIELNIKTLPASPTIESACSENSAIIHDHAPENIVLDWSFGDDTDIDKAFSKASHIVETTLSDARLAPTCMEPRAGIGQWDEKTAKFTLIAGTQGVNLVSKILAEHVFDTSPENLRVITYDVGGGFGMKSQPYSEYAAILFAARALRRPVKWKNSRLESFQTDTAGRDGLLHASMAFDEKGKILALKFHGKVGMGAYISTYGAVFAINNTKNCLSSAYTIPIIKVDIQMIFTNSAPLGPYRGAGRPEAIIIVEQLLDLGAKKIGIARPEIRRQNLIPKEAMPYQTPVDQIYDSGDFEALLNKALKISEWSGFENRLAKSMQSGKLRGIGICYFLEIAGGILNEPAQVSVEKGKVVLRLGVQEMGQSHLTTYTNLIANHLNIDISDVILVEGDSSETPGLTPAVASRSLMMAGSASTLACDELIEKGRELTGTILEASAEDVDYGLGKFTVSGTDLEIKLLDLPEAASKAGIDANCLEITREFISPGMSFPNGCHVAEIEIDPETGQLEIVNYVAVDDVGNILQETVVEGQIHGGIVQGLGQILGEKVIYDNTGQLLTGSFMDYPMPRADEIPFLTVENHPVPCTTNPLGVKGAGESGVAGALPSTYSAVIDALNRAGVENFELPATAPRIWQALNKPN